MLLYKPLVKAIAGLWKLLVRLRMRSLQIYDLSIHTASRATQSSTIVRPSRKAKLDFVDINA